mgnify:CR=1 FL=1
MELQDLDKELRMRKSIGSNIWEVANAFTGKIQDLEDKLKNEYCYWQIYLKQWTWFIYYYPHTKNFIVLLAKCGNLIQDISIHKLSELEKIIQYY